MIAAAFALALTSTLPNAAVQHSPAVALFEVEASSVSASPAAPFYMGSHAGPMNEASPEHSQLWASAYPWTTRPLMGLQRAESSTVAPATKPAAAPKAKRPAKRPKKASTVLAQVQKYHASLRDLRAKFRQTYYKPKFSALTPLEGVLEIKKPNLMKWDYGGQNHDIYANESWFWIVEHDSKQVVTTRVGPQDDINVAMKFLFGGKALLRDFLVRYASDKRVARYGDASHHVLQLKPRKKNSHYKGLLLVVDAQTGRVDDFLVAFTDGATSFFELSEVQTNVGIPATHFAKKIPKGYVEANE